MHYQRAIPVRFRAVSKVKFYCFALGLTESANISQINNAVARASEGFRLKCEMLENISLESVPESELDMLLLEIARRSSARTGEYLYNKHLFKGAHKISIQISKQLASFDDTQDNVNKKPKMRVFGCT